MLSFSSSPSPVSAVCLSPFNLFQLPSPWSGETFRVSYPTSVKPFWKHPHRHTEACLLGDSKLTISPGKAKPPSGLLAVLRQGVLGIRQRGILVFCYHQVQERRWGMEIAWHLGGSFRFFFLFLGLCQPIVKIQISRVNWPAQSH